MYKLKKASIPNNTFKRRSYTMGNNYYTNDKPIKTKIRKHICTKLPFSSLQWQVVFVVMITLPGIINGQQTRSNIPVDSSYSVESEYKKHLKKFPFITIAETGDTSGLTFHKDLVYANLGQRSLHLDIIMPSSVKKSSPLPVVVMIHGGGWRSGDKHMEWPMACELARRGYATVCVEYRLSPEALYPAAVIDVQTAIRWVKANAHKYGLAKNRVALMGNSSGGQIAALLGTINGKHHRFTGPLYRKYSNKVMAVINMDGILAFIHPESEEGQDKPAKPSAATLWFGQPAYKEPESRNEASALYQVHKNSAPIFFINSSLPRFHAGRDDMIKKMTQLGIATRVYEHENTMHTFWLFQPWFEPAMEKIDQFLSDYL